MAFLKCKPVFELIRKGVDRHELFGCIYCVIYNEKVNII